MKFLIQSDNKGLPKEDFCYTLIKSINENNYLNNDNNLEYLLFNGEYSDINNCYIHSNMIPIGSVEFVKNYIKFWFDKTPKPLNIPTELLLEKFTLRKVFNGTEKDINDNCFIKSNNTIKGFTEFIYDKNKNIPKGNYQISEIIDIESEYRVFVFHDMIIGMKHYIGDYFLYPNSNLIKDMVLSWKSSPKAYTLDIGVTSNNETVIIECHDFFSVGLYGFDDLKLPYMYSHWFYEYIKK